MTWNQKYTLIYHYHSELPCHCISLLSCIFGQYLKKSSRKHTYPQKLTVIFTYQKSLKNEFIFVEGLFYLVKTYCVCNNNPNFLWSLPMNHIFKTYKWICFVTNCGYISLFTTMVGVLLLYITLKTHTVIYFQNFGMVRVFEVILHIFSSMILSC